MRRFYIFAIIMLAAVGALSAQPRANDKDKGRMIKEVQEFKMKYLAQEMDLKEDQQEEFFKLYEEMAKEKRDVYKNAEQMEKKLKDSPDATEEDYQSVTEAINKANAENAEIEKRYEEKFSQFLTSKQIYKMKEAEKSFRNRIQEMRQSKRHEKKKGPTAKAIKPNLNQIQG